MIPDFDTCQIFFFILKNIKFTIRELSEVIFFNLTVILQHFDSFHFRNAKLMLHAEYDAVTYMLTLT